MLTIDFGVRDRIHEMDRNNNPDRHWPGILKFKNITREIAQYFCTTCAKEYNIHDLYYYDNHTASFIKRDKNDP